MAKVIMVQGTTSNAGKSLTVAALCRIFKQDGLRAAPFKSQNMALNSFITADGAEMGRAQVMQAEAAGIAPDVRMNPILLKPTSDCGSQVIVNGKARGTMPAKDYYAYKQQLVPDIMEAYNSLAAEYDVIVIEGAGSPAEINLRENDIVNMGMAEMADAPVLLVGDIDRGGVFASLYGTVELLEPQERARIKGLIVNKFRGDVDILKPGLDMMEQRLHIPFVGVVPYLHLDLDDEDSLSERLHAGQQAALIDIAVIRVPRISNFTDFAPLERMPGVSVRYVSRAQELKNPDLIVLPGSKNTMDDLKWMRQNGIEAAIKKHAAAGNPVFGVCGGYQMMGLTLADPDGVEAGGTMDGMGLLPTHTVFCADKTTTQVHGTFERVDGLFSGLSGTAFDGYEIHMGETTYEPGAKPLTHLTRGETPVADGAQNGACCGTYVHGIFDREAVSEALVSALLARRGLSDADIRGFDTEAYKQQQYDALADAVRSALDMQAVYRILNGE
ncbi:cobyric acid synthase [Butyricicoccus sp.]|uniref:cobyric acid synthase n=1 Tax=Butyricicoccus sp. TaxID=2049021 RepID=UPI003F18A9EC